MVFAAVSSGGPTEEPRIDVLGVYRREADANARIAVETRKLFPVGAAVEVKLYDTYEGRKKGVVRGHTTAPSQEVSFTVELETGAFSGDERALPKASVRTGYDGKHVPLFSDVAGTTRIVQVPWVRLEKCGGFIFGGKETPDFEVRKVDIRDGARTIFASCYEPSTTGWDDRLSVVFFAEKKAAEAHCRGELLSRLSSYHDVFDDAEYWEAAGKKMPAMDDGETDSEGELFPKVPPNQLKPRGFPKHRRSPFFNKWGDIDQRYAEFTHNGLFGAIIRNFHGDYQCNPEMEETFWVEEHRIRGLTATVKATATSKAASGKKASSGKGAATHKTSGGKVVTSTRKATTGKKDTGSRKATTSVTRKASPKPKVSKRSIKKTTQKKK